MKFKQIFAVGLVIGIISVATMAFAQTENVKGVDPLSDEEKVEMFNKKKEIIEKRVEEGVITQETADMLIKEFEGCLDCDDDCEPREEGLGKQYDLRFGLGRNSEANGQGSGEGLGNGQGRGNGQGQGRGQGNGLGNGRGIGYGEGNCEL